MNSRLQSRDCGAGAGGCFSASFCQDRLSLIRLTLMVAFGLLVHTRHSSSCDGNSSRGQAPSTFDHGPGGFPGEECGEREDGELKSVIQADLFHQIRAFLMPH